MAGRTLVEPLRVRVTREGVPVAGIAVDWSTAYGTIVADGPTDAQGLAAATWTLGVGSPGVRRARATLTGNGGGWVEFTTTSIDPELTAVFNARSDAVVGSRVSLRARLSWRGEPIVGEAIEWFGAGVTAAAPTTDAAGEVSATWQVGLVAGPHSAIARVRAYASGGPTAHFRVDALPGPAAGLQWVGSGPGIEYWHRGRTAPLSVSGRVTDAHGNGVPEVPVSWSLQTVGGTAIGSATATSMADGYVSAAIPVGGGAVNDDLIVVGMSAGLAAITSTRLLVDFLYADVNGFGPDWYSPMETTVPAGMSVRVASVPSYPYSIPFTMFVLDTSGHWQELGVVGAPSDHPDGIMRLPFDTPGTYQLRAEIFPGWTDVLTVVVTP